MLAERPNYFFPLLLLVLLVLIITWSVWHPRDLFTWFLESFPVLIAVPLLGITYRYFRFSRLAYVMIWLHAIVLLVGAHYTYAENPLFEWIRITLEQDRNYYDRFGHVAQGVFPAIVAREILLRLSPLQPGKWLFFLVVCVVLAISAFYEMIEWWVATTSGDAAVSFLATQGDVWDTQWDMFLALCGAIAAQLLFGRLHDQSMQRVAGTRVDMQIIG
jgi:putative membrane protein